MANLAGIAGGAVPPLASARPRRVKEILLACSPTLARAVQFVRCQRLSRLCVLMNPCPAGLEIHPDLAGYRVFPLQCSETNPARMDISKEKNHAMRRQTGQANWENAVNAKKSFSCGRTVPGGGKRYTCESASWPNGRNTQFTNRRMRTFIAAPSARKVNKTEDPP